ncbi:TfuA-like protein [Lentzea sp. NPDC034063]|uniref:TfuA-like protein n=1 Tax=unclassified Lentzea TaxID=2643253 RepID=UPI0034054944
MAVHVFAGPTLPGAAVLEVVPHALVHPPVAYGDLLRIPFASSDVVVIVDGYYHQSAAVRHKEILALLDADVRVVGCSSMGALRAAELDVYGMVGNGYVYEMFRDRAVDADDEVAVAHTPAPEYRKLSEPLVAIRYVVTRAVREGLVSSTDGNAVVALARQLPYTARSWRALGALISRDVAELSAAFARIEAFKIAGGADFDVKAIDALDTLSRLDELISFVGVKASPCSNGDTENVYVREWRADCSGTVIDGVHVGNGDVLRFQQIYLADFPRRWEAFALERIAQSSEEDDPAAPVEDRAVAAAEVSGLTYETLTAGQRAEWLTAEEQSAAAVHEQMVKVLRRSYRSQSPAHDLMAANPDLVKDADAQKAVAEATLINREVATWGATHSIDHLKPDVLRNHLAGVWRVSPVDEELLAAARDRGLRSLDEAIRAVRPFYLRAHFNAANDPTPGGRAV